MDEVRRSAELEERIDDGEELLDIALDRAAQAGFCGIGRGGC